MDKKQSHASLPYIFDLNLNKILIVDDTVENLQLLQLIFRKTEFEVVVAGNGYEGLQKATEEYPFLILSDIQMPGMDGYTFCSELKKNPKTENISVILITSHSHAGAQVSRGLDIGADDFITRPIEPAELLSRVRAVVRLKHAELAAQKEAFTTARKNEELARINALVEQEVVQRTQELLQEKTKLETILTGMADGVVVLDAARNVQTINHAAQKILSISMDIIGKPVDDDSLNRDFLQIVRSIKFEDGENWLQDIRRPDGTKQYVKMHISSLAGGDAAVGWVILLSDVTSIIEAEQMKMRFMTGVTHELKTPLSVIRLHTNNMLNYAQRLTDEQRQAMLTGIREQTEVLGTLIDQVLTLTKLDSGQTSASEGPALLTEVISQAISKVLPLAADKQIRINWKPKRETISVDVPAEKLALVAGNLLENAIKYTQDGAGDITVTVSETKRKGERFAVLSVADSGIGIDPKDRQKIFDRFFRADTAHTIPGTGLGLSIVREILAAHGGDISVQSEPGHGSEFSVFLPLVHSD